MKLIRRTTQFKKDVKRAKKRGKDVRKLKVVIETLARGEALDERYRDHALVGVYRGTRDCHIEPDWLLIYETTEEELVLPRISNLINGEIGRFSVDKLINMLSRAGMHVRVEVEQKAG